MLFGVPTGVRSATKLYSLTSLAMLIFYTAAYAILCHMSERTPRTMRTFALFLNNNFNAPTHVLFVLRSDQYSFLPTARQHLFFGSRTLPL